MKVNTPTTPPNEPIYENPGPIVLWDDFGEEYEIDDDFDDFDYIEEINPEYEPDIEDDQI